MVICWLLSYAYVNTHKTLQIIHFHVICCLSYQYLNEKVDDLGKLSLIDPKQKINIDGFFDTEIVQVSFQINQYQFTIRTMMKSINIYNEPLLNFISKLSNRSIKREKSIYIPLNYGLFLVYENLKLFLKTFF